MIDYLNSYMKPTFALLAMVGLMSGACSTSQSNAFLPSYQKYPIQIAETVERLELYSRPGGMSLSARDELSVLTFLQTYRQFGDGPLYVNIPGNVQNSGVNETQLLLKRLMAQSGLNHAPVQMGQYPVQFNGQAPVVVSFRRLKSLIPDCSRHIGDLTETGSNEAYAGFGCSQQANLAAMISDPRQLIEPYAMTPPNTQRRMAVYDKYIAGENPSSDQPNRQETAASDG